MNESLGSVITGLVIDQNEHFYFVQRQGVTYALNKEEGSHQLGDAVEGFVYPNQKGQFMMTTHIPKAQRGRYAFATVTGVRRDLGVFVDIGLSKRDIVVSCDDLPSMGQLWPKEGDRLMVALRVDDKNRLWGELADESIFKTIARRGTREQQNKNLQGTVFRLKMAGTYLLTDDYYIGFVHPSERFSEPRLGEQVKGRVIGVRPDGVLNMSLKPRSYEVINDDAQMILAFLQKAPEHKIPYWDKSTPEEIQAKFAISKGQFKRALGHLMKENLIEQHDGWTILKG